MWDEETSRKARETLDELMALVGELVDKHYKERMVCVEPKSSLGQRIIHQWREERAAQVQKVVRSFPTHLLAPPPIIIKKGETMEGYVLTRCPGCKKERKITAGEIDEGDYPMCDVCFLPMIAVEAAAMAAVPMPEVPNGEP